MARTGRDEVEAAYFTLLRAREKVESLRRYEEFLRDERRRLQRFVADGDALDAHVDPKLRRAFRQTDETVGKSLRGRHEVIDAELARVPGRIEAAEAFVEDAQAEHDHLRGG
jgi:hypothetical protein